MDERGNGNPKRIFGMNIRTIISIVLVAAAILTALVVWGKVLKPQQQQQSEKIKELETQYSVAVDRFRTQVRMSTHYRQEAIKYDSIANYWKTKEHEPQIFYIHTTDSILQLPVDSTGPIFIQGVKQTAKRHANPKW